MPQINLRIADQLSDQLNKRKDAARGGLSEAVRESLTRYFALLDYERQQITGQFTGGELSLLADICNGTMFTGGMIPLGVLADAEDCEDFYFEKWSVDRDALLEKLRSLTATQEYTLVDAIEKFWTSVSEQPSFEQPDPRKLLD